MDLVDIENNQMFLIIYNEAIVCLNSFMCNVIFYLMLLVVVFFLC